MAESTTFSKEESRGTRQDLSSLQATPRPEAEAEALAKIYDLAIRAYEKRTAAEIENGSEAGEATKSNHTGGIVSEERA